MLSSGVDIEFVATVSTEIGISNIKSIQKRYHHTDISRGLSSFKKKKKCSEIGLLYVYENCTL